jgi:Flp pilus assembly protein TadG
MLYQPLQPRRRGATVFECAIVYPVTFFLILGLVIGGMGIFRYQQVAHLAHEAARFASVHGGNYTQDNAAAIAAGTKPKVNEAYLTNTLVAGGSVDLDPTRLAVQVNISTTNGTFDWDNTTATYNRWPYSTVIQSGAVVPVQNTVSVTVTYTWMPEMYLIGPINLKSTAVAPMTY